MNINKLLGKKHLTDRERQRLYQDVPYKSEIQSGRRLTVTEKKIMKKLGIDKY